MKDLLRTLANRRWFAVNASGTLSRTLIHARTMHANVPTDVDLHQEPEQHNRNVDYALGSGGRRYFNRPTEPYPGFSAISHLPRWVGLLSR
ncbi:MAG: hypothetical protein AMS22_08345 [Thiotrichales bacterium SG8_50]|nr:MAG: hypothetical protein AMS22_08345 [Thiotrichales bacterium SG8_50]